MINKINLFIGAVIAMVFAIIISIISFSINPLCATLKSILKSFKLASLQRKLHNPNIQDYKDMVQHLVKNLDNNKNKEILEEYLDLCYNDWIIETRKLLNITKDELRDAYWDLIRGGAGIYIKGHFVALSAISYSEPLIFYIITKRNNKISDLERAFILTDYFNDKFQPDYLIKYYCNEEMQKYGNIL